ncbi:MAG: inositol monophosphatase family protein [Patescibacteria group bacterium]
MDKTYIKEYQEFSKKTLYQAGKILHSYTSTFHVQKVKDRLSLDVATDADFAAEKYIVDQIKTTYPTHSILTEETSGLATESEFEWIIDPLDGTKEFIRHSPYYYSLLALEYKGKPICGAGYQPEINRMFSGAIGVGADLNNQRIVLSQENMMKKSFIYFGLPVCDMLSTFLKPYLSVIEKLTSSCYRLRNTPWDVEALFNIAYGLCEGFIIPPHEPGRGPKWWDIASGIAVLLANGGTITDFKGNPYHARSNEYGLVASNGKIHEELLDCIRTSYK